MSNASTRGWRLLAWVALAVLTLGVPGNAAQARVFDPVTFTLKNGLQVVVISNHRAPIVSHMIWYKVGGADDRPGKSGLAHFLEHLMFKGTKRFGPGVFSKMVARVGGRENAFTSQDYTGYYQNVAVDRLPTVMELEADRMTGLVLDDKAVNPERQVILEERRSRVDNDPGSILGEQVRAALYQNHGYGTPVIGWEHEIRGLGRTDALDFYRRYYVPNNAILIVAGDITAEQLRPLAEKYYGRIPRGKVPPRVRPMEPAHKAARRLELRDRRIRLPSWSRRYLAPSYNVGESKHAYALQVLSRILGGGATSRLHRKLVVEGKLATGAGTGYDALVLDHSQFVFYASARPGVKVARLEAAMEAEIARLLEKGVTEDEVARAVSRLRAAAVYARDNLFTAPRILGMALTTGRTIADVEAWPDRIGAVTVAQVNAAARAVFRSEQSVTSLLLPLAKSKKSKAKGKTR